MLASIQEKRRQFEDGSWADEIAVVVSMEETTMRGR